MRLPSPGRILGGLGRGLRSVGYFISDVFYVASRAPRDGVRALRDAWHGLERSTRARVTALVGVLAGAAIVVLVVLPNAPCEFPGGEECAPPDDARPLVPAEALAYAHINLDPENPQAERAAELANRTPLLAREALGRLLGLAVGAGGQPPDLGEIAPWFGGEAALAVLPGTERDVEQVQLLEYADEGGARAYAESIVAGSARSETYEGVEILEDERGLASALVGGFVAIGPSGAVRAVVDAARSDEGDTLAGEEAATSVLDALPRDRLAEAYLSRDGIAAFIAPANSPLAALEPLVGAGASEGVAAGLSVADDAYRLAIRSDLEAGRTTVAPGFFAAFEPFAPGLVSELPPDTLAYVGFGDPSQTVGRLLDQATAQAPAIAAGLARLISNLRAAEGVDVEEDLLGALGDEAALAVIPRPADEEGEAAAGEAGPGESVEPVVPPGLQSVPYVSFLADGADGERALGALARLQRPLIKELGVGLGAPAFQDLQIGDVTAHVLNVSRAVQFTYAVVDSTLVIANDPAGVQEVEGGEGGLDDSPAFQAATDELPAEPSLLAYLDLAGLIGYAERAGLAEDPAYAEIAPDLSRLAKLGLTVTAETDALATDATLTIAADEDDGGG